jgi:hypothetical protein
MSADRLVGIRRQEENASWTVIISVFSFYLKHSLFRDVDFSILISINFFRPSIILIYKDLLLNPGWESLHLAQKSILI